MKFKIRVKILKYIVTHNLTYRIFIRYKWFQNLVIETARELVDRWSTE